MTSKDIIIAALILTVILIIAEGIRDARKARAPRQRAIAAIHRANAANSPGCWGCEALADLDEVPEMLGQEPPEPGSFRADGLEEALRRIQRGEA